ncbi:Drug/Metabolite Transporter (DMT) Superfamily [Phytophthora infestans T30-4]|uniref:Drug/Metabolite Transporter (DMT) Superfamily n=1 Tax=Phytophthora infestans (strain T30-4) TaxID=403677 RepID=D0N1L4_PHYIT|nr:Drug/Metabolite Transporter (DMT) Superfamily [Phytophthora infestans T30-4]XP_002905352.1 Drug/Metabolite Transporter (DMT) Superfamily [Phytophthora infestans T30-4]EEY58813.1 Drug/Metabolite Transporter (DMT) Superfamily [Phytophthora infestans T30-4]EEY68193.1 Drug/Metabolite Transporter (DMT) Superfamily [Phytophthora infestans T30-4]|eukprot:XP_002895287.1 Drug/Metabolite Transporter (DMT) Superfamily [Phytophthora infestans T30-4]
MVTPLVTAMGGSRQCRRLRSHISVQAWLSVAVGRRLRLPRVCGHHLIQYIFNDLSFEAPFFLTSFGMALFSVNLPIYYVTKVWLPQLGRGLSGLSVSGLPQVKSETGTEVKQTAHNKATLRRTVVAAAVVAPLWFIANFTYNESLNLTSVTSSTILSATSSVFTLILAVWILKERFTWPKALGVALCMAGNCCVQL